MVYCSNCGIVMETYDCPVCGFKNYKPEKPGKAHASDKEPQAHHKCGPAGSIHMLAGAAGSFIIASAAIVLGLLPLYLAMQDGWSYFESDGIYVIYILATIIFIMGSSVLVGGLYGLFKHYGGYQGLVALIFAMVSPVILLVFTLLAIEHESYSSWYRSYDYYSIGPELWLGHLFVGIMFVLIGMTWRSIFFKVGYDQPNLPVGAFFMLAGALFMVYFGITGIPWIIIAVAGFSAGVLFLLGRMGTEKVQDARPKPRPHWTSSPPNLPPPID